MSFWEQEGDGVWIYPGFWLVREYQPHERDSVDSQHAVGWEGDNPLLEVVSESMTFASSHSSVVQPYVSDHLYEQYDDTHPAVNNASGLSTFLSPSIPGSSTLPNNGLATLPSTPSTTQSCSCILSFVGIVW